MSEDIDGAMEAFTNSLQEKLAEISLAINKGMEAAAEYCTEEAKVTAAGIAKSMPPINAKGQNMWENTGTLPNTIGYTVDPDDSSSLTIYCSAPCAAYIEYGTGIYSANGDGRQTPWMFESNTGAFVKTQGMRANPFMYPSVFNNLDQIQDIINENIAEAVK